MGSEREEMRKVTNWGRWGSMPDMQPSDTAPRAKIAASFTSQSWREEQTGRERERGREGEREREREGERERERERRGRGSRTKNNTNCLNQAVNASISKVQQQIHSVSQHTTG